MERFLLVILSACNSCTENILGFIDEILQPHVKVFIPKLKVLHTF